MQFDGWVPDSRLALDGAETYAEVKPVTELPMDVAQQILNAGCDGDVLILAGNRAMLGGTEATAGPLRNCSHRASATVIAELRCSVTVRLDTDAAGKRRERRASRDANKESKDER